MAAASSTPHIPVRAATPDLIATYNIGATQEDYCQSVKTKRSFENKLTSDLTHLLQVCLRGLLQDYVDITTSSPAC